MDYRCQTPVLLLFFNRPQHAVAVLERLRLVRPQRLYVHCDGPRANVENELEKVLAVRELVKTIDWDCTIHTLFREHNMGLRAGVSDAISWFFNQEEMGIVLEDDCLPDVSFFPFCETLLKEYQYEPKVMHIGGFNAASFLTSNLVESYFFSKFAFVWGWASWRRAWDNMSLTLDGLDSELSQKRLAELTPNKLSRTYLRSIFEATRQRRNNSWAYAWLYSILNAEGLCVVPAKNLVQNTGIGDSDATHTQKKDEKAAIRAEELDFPLIHPNGIKRIPALDQQLFYHTQKSRWRLFLWYLLKKSGLR
jgi:hypothetical protein